MRILAPFATQLSPAAMAMTWALETIGTASKSKLSSVFSGGRFRLGKIRRRFAQNLVGLTKLAALPLKSLHNLGDIVRPACSLTAIDLGLLHPFV